MRLIKRLSTVATTAALVTAGVAAATAAPAAAAATDDQPCARPQVSRASHWVQYCPLWKANVPVYSSPDLGNGAPVVGYLVQGGSANWFVGDRYRSNYTYSGYSNHWWAYTLADNGRWGWTPEVFFAGGGDNETDGGLYLCDAGPKFNDCPTLP
ncbi:hypothetical protein ACIA5D_39770 [Actinoplanes sp. NPDC051513]|uniref:hypothetical protein n=1 Tax=Actinoplanes sp. NPDC051513 TaxID=3363908 RepID=UPI0037B6077D